MILLRFQLMACVLVFFAFTAWLVSLWPWAILIVLTLLARRPRYWWSSAHGTARWADAHDLKGMINAVHGIIIGYLETGAPSKLSAARGLFSPWVGSRDAVDQFLDAVFHSKRRRLVRLSTSVHTAVFAPTGAGKGVGIAIPTLLTCPDSMVVIDPKGENYEKTAAVRRAMGHKVVRIDPFNVCGPGGDTFNPLERIVASYRDALDDCRALAEMLVVRTGEEKETHWNDGAEAFLAAVIALVVLLAKGEERSLQFVREILTDPESLAKAIAKMRESKAWDGMLARMGGRLSHYRDRELASTLTTANRHTGNLDTPAIAKITTSSSFDPAELRPGKMTVYIVLPPKHLRTQASLLRMLIGTFMLAVVQGGLSDKKVWFVCDEAKCLGALPQIADALDKYRGYGIRLLLIYQSMGQLQEVWPKGADQTLLSNTDQVFFAVNDNDTAEYVSKRLGEETISVASGGTNAGGSYQTSTDKPGVSNSTSWGRNDGWNQVGRALLKPAEVQALSQDVAISFVAGKPPIWTRLVRYYEGGFVPTTWTRIRAGLSTLLRTAVIVSLSGLLVVLAAAGLLHQTPAQPGAKAPSTKRAK
jgi:type IV secretion system protein VirD4